MNKARLIKREEAVAEEEVRKQAQERPNIQALTAAVRKKARQTRDETGNLKKARDKLNKLFKE